MFKTKKKRHHFVSQFYLKSWAGSDGQILTWVKGEFKRRGPRAVAFSNLFYKVDGLDSKTAKNMLDENSKTSITLKDSIAAVIDILQKSRIFEKLTPEYTDIVKSNLIEEFYADIEDDIADTFKLLTNRRYDEINIGEFHQIVRFMTVQLSRTRKIREKIYEGLDEILDDRRREIDGICILQSLMIADRLAINLVEWLYKLTIIENDSDLGFITNDNPVVNLNGSEIQELRLFWPITPRLAALITKAELSNEEGAAIKQKLLKNGVETRYFLDVKKITREEVAAYNQGTWERRFDYAFFANDADAKATFPLGRNQITQN